MERLVARAGEAYILGLHSSRGSSVVGCVMVWAHGVEVPAMVVLLLGVEFLG